MKLDRRFWKKPLAGFDFWRDAGKCLFYPDLAQWAVDFFERELVLTTGEFAGKPFLLQGWQKQLVGHLFGWLRPDGTRRFRKLFLYIPRKNGKTELAAGLGIIFFVADNEPAAEIYCGALTIPQANIFFGKVKKMIKHNPYLADRIKPPRGRTNRVLHDDPSDSMLMVLAADEDAAQGFNAHCGVIDELHTLKDGGFPGALSESMGTRKQPMLIEITTAADAGESFCNSELEYAESVRDGRIKDAELMPIVFRATDHDDPGSPATWRRCNPSVGVTIPESYLASQYRRLSQTATGLARFKKYYLNQQTTKAGSWIPVEFWRMNRVDFNVSDLNGRRCFLAVDRSSVSDISAVGVFFPDENIYLCRFIVPRETADGDAAYLQWSEDGRITISEDRSITDDELFEIIEVLAETYRVEALGYDAWRMSQLAAWIARPRNERLILEGRYHDSGLGIECIPVRQDFRSLSEVINRTEIEIRNGELRHFGCPVLEWMFGNCRVAKDHKENIKLVKENPNSAKKIDGIITLIMAKKVAEEKALSPQPFTEEKKISWM